MSSSLPRRARSAALSHISPNQGRHFLEFANVAVDANCSQIGDFGSGRLTDLTEDISINPGLFSGDADPVTPGFVPPVSSC